MTEETVDKPTKICIVSCHPEVPSGYGVGSKTLIEMMTGLGYEVCVYCTYGMQSHVETIKVNGKTVNIYPSNCNGDNALSNLYAVRWVENYDVIFSFLDLFSFDVKYMEDYWISLVMIDSDPFMPTNLFSYKAVNMVLPVTNWAMDMTDKCPNEHKLVKKFPVPINESEYYIEDKDDARRRFKKELNIKGKMDKLITVNAANIGDGAVERKNFPELVKWWAGYTKDHPEDYLYLHTDVNGLQTRGINIKQILDLYDADTTNIRFAHPVLYGFALLTSNFLRMVYNASDVMLVPSHSEGFGMPYVEAAMCGCMPVGNNFGTGAEVINNLGGVTVDCVESYYIKGSVKSKSYAADIDKAVNEAYQKIEDTKDSGFVLNQNAREHYSMSVNRVVLQDIIDSALVHKEELTLTEAKKDAQDKKEKAKAKAKERLSSRVSPKKR